tara:strand:- start:2158 stop:2862 length:705 start_codon:yes stop_codon:yes gene_type:complete
MIKKLFVPIFILCVISCNQTSSDGKKEDGGPKNGLVHTYNEDGSLSASINYKNNLRHGLALDYYKDGKLRAEIDYVNGLKQGLAKWYHKNGKIFRRTAYIADQREGFQKKYYEEGDLMSVAEFHENEPGIGLKEYNKSGQERKSKAAFVFGEKTPLDNGAVKIEVRLNNKVKEVNIFQGSLKDGKFMHEGLVDINKTANMGYAIIPKGETEVSVVAKYKTRYKNYRVLHGKAKL